MDGAGIHQTLQSLCNLQADLKNVDAEVLDAGIKALQELKKDTNSKEEVKPSPGSVRVRLFDALPDDWTRQIRASAPAIDENKNHRFESTGWLLLKEKLFVDKLLDESLRAGETSSEWTYTSPEMMCKQLDTIRAHAIVNAAPLTIRSLTEVFLHRMASIVTSSQGEGFSVAFNYCCLPDLIVRDDDIGETIMYPQHVQDNITVYCGNTKIITSLIGEQKKYLDLILPEYDLHAFYLACRPEIMFVGGKQPEYFV